MTEEVQKV